MSIVNICTLLHYAHTVARGDQVRTFIEKLRGLREDNDLTQTQIANVLGTSQTMYARYERGANEMPLRHFIALCRFYNVSADYFLDTAPSKLHKQKVPQYIPKK